MVLGVMTGISMTIINFLKPKLAKHYVINVIGGGHWVSPPYLQNIN